MVVVMRPEAFMWSLAIFQLVASCASHQRSGLRGSICLMGRKLVGVVGVAVVNCICRPAGVHVKT